VNARDLVAGPGEAFVTVRLADRELALRLDRIARLELTRAPAGGESFRVPDAGVGFGSDG
jgi:hypothetical protein